MKLVPIKNEITFYVKKVKKLCFNNVSNKALEDHIYKNINYLGTKISEEIVFHKKKLKRNVYKIKTFYITAGYCLLIS